MKLSTVPTITLDPSHTDPELIGVNGQFANLGGVFGSRPFAFHPTQNSAIVVGDNKTFVFYLGDDYDIWCIVKNNLTGVWSSAIEVADGHTSSDSHNYCSAIIDSSGYIHIFFGCHNSDLYYQKSTNTYDVSAWSVEASLDAFATYPQSSIDSAGIIYLFYRGSVDATGKGRYCKLRTSDDGGSTWAAATTIVDSGDDGIWVYAGVTGIGSDDSIHLIFTLRTSAGADDPSEFTNIYYAKSVNGGAAWTESDDTGYELPISGATAEVIYAGSYVFPGHINLDGSNNPQGVYVLSPATSYFFLNEIHYVYLSEGVWQDDTLTSSAYDVCHHILINGTNFYIIGSKYVNGKYKIYVIYSSDSGANWTEYPITHDSSLSNIYPVVNYGMENGINVCWSVVKNIYYGDNSYILDKL